MGGYVSMIDGHIDEAPATDREKLSAMLVDAIIDSDDNYGFPNTDQVADHLIANGVTIQRWIPVTERLPERWENVLTVRTDGVVRLDFIGSAGVWYKDVDFVRYPVTN